MPDAVHQQKTSICPYNGMISSGRQCNQDLLRRIQVLSAFSLPGITAQLDQRGGHDRGCGCIPQDARPAGGGGRRRAGRASIEIPVRYLISRQVGIIQEKVGNMSCLIEVFLIMGVPAWPRAHAEESE